VKDEDTLFGDVDVKTSQAKKKGSLLSDSDSDDLFGSSSKMDKKAGDSLFGDDIDDDWLEGISGVKAPKKKEKKAEVKKEVKEEVKVKEEKKEVVVKEEAPPSSKKQEKKVNIFFYFNLLIFTSVKQKT